MPLTVFRHLAIDNALSPPTEAEIKAIEGKLGTILPEDFKRFLAVSNGGYLDYEVEVRHPERSERMAFCELFATRQQSSDSPWGTYLGELESARRTFRLPNNVLPIARDGGGSFLFLDLTLEGRGRIVAFVQGKPAWTGLAQTNAFVEVATSFSDYVDKLFISEDVAKDVIDDAVDHQDAERLSAIRQWLDIGMPDWRQRLGPKALEALDRT